MREAPELNARIAAVKLPVTDLPRSAHFYRDVVGLTEELTVPECGCAQFSMGGVPFCLYVPGMGGGTGTPGACDCVHLAVEDIAATYAEIQARGGAVPEGLQTAADGVPYFELVDPDGNCVKVLQLAPPLGV